MAGVIRPEFYHPGLYHKRFDMAAKDDAAAKAKAEAEAKAEAANPDNITSADKAKVDLAQEVVKRTNEDALREQEVQDADSDKDAERTTTNGQAPRGAERHWTAEGMDAVTFDGDPPL